MGLEMGVAFLAERLCPFALGYGDVLGAGALVGGGPSGSLAWAEVCWWDTQLLSAPW